MAYMISIIRASQEFEGSAWAATTQHTDGRLRRRAKRNGPVSTLPSMPSALLARPGGRTGATAASAPPTRRRTAVSSPRMTPMSANASKPSSRLSSLSLELPPEGAPKPRVRSAEACRNWNRSKCSFPGCRYAHHCSSCRGSHPAVECPARSANTHPIGPTRRNPQFPWVHANPPY